MEKNPFKRKKRIAVNFKAIEEYLAVLRKHNYVLSHFLNTKIQEEAIRLEASSKK